MDANEKGGCLPRKPAAARVDMEIAGPPPHGAPPFREWELNPRQEVMGYFVNVLRGVMGGAHPVDKRMYSTRPKEPDGSTRPWDVHQSEGHLARGIDDYIEGRLKEAYLVPGSVRLRGAWLACGDVDDVSPVDADDEGTGETWAERAASALGFACSPVLDYAKPDESGKRHVWVLAAEPVGNGNLYVSGRKVGEWRGRGGTVGTGMRLYEGEGQALMEALQAGEGTVLEGEVLAQFLAKGFGAAGGASPAPKDTGEISTGAGDVPGGAHPRILGAVWKWVGSGQPFSPAAAVEYLLEHGTTPRTPGSASGELERMIIGAEGKIGRDAIRDEAAGLPWQGTGPGSGGAAGGAAGNGSGNATGVGPGTGAGPDGENDEPPADTLEGDVTTWKRWKSKAIAKPPASLSGLKREAPVLLSRIVARLSGEPDRGTGNDAVAKLNAIQAAFGEGGEEAARAVLDDYLPKPRLPVPVDEVDDERPAALLRLAGGTGGVLTLGTVGVLSGEGGGGKSALTASLALALASRGEGEAGTLAGGLFDAPVGGGRVLMATWEDVPAMTRWRIEAAAAMLAKEGISEDATSRVHLLDLAGAALYGPGERGEGSAGLYNARPEPLQGWFDLWAAVKAIGPRLVVIDPALASFVGNSNEAAQVREYLSALTVAADKHGCAVLLVAHSTKSARKGDGNKPPDPFDPGQVGGSAAWTDGVRSALVLDWDDDRGPGERRLSVAKSNYGPSRVTMPLEAVTVGKDDKAHGGAVVGFKAVEAKGWDEPPRQEGKVTQAAVVKAIATYRGNPAALAKIEDALRKAKGNSGSSKHV